MEDVAWDFDQIILDFIHENGFGSGPPFGCNEGKKHKAEQEAGSRDIRTISKWRGAEQRWKAVRWGLWAYGQKNVETTPFRKDFNNFEKRHNNGQQN